MSVNTNDDVVLRHPIVHDLREISKIEGLVIKRADFETGDIVVVVTKNDTSFAGVMSSIMFIDMVDKTGIQAVDFETGEITIKWYPDGVTKVYANLNITKGEIELLKQNKKINAIKDVRLRTGLGLADAKTLVESAEYELRRRGIIR